MIPVDPKKSSLYSIIRSEFGVGVFDKDGKPQGRFQRIYCSYGNG